MLFTGILIKANEKSMAMEQLTLYITVIVAVSSIGLNFAQRKQAQATATAAITEAVLNLIEPLNDRIDILEEFASALKERIKQLECENKTLRQENTELNDRIDILEDIVKQLECENKTLRQENTELKQEKSSIL